MKKKWGTMIYLKKLKVCNNTMKERGREKNKCKLLLSNLLKKLVSTMRIFFPWKVKILIPYTALLQTTGQKWVIIELISKTMYIKSWRLRKISCQCLSNFSQLLILPIIIRWTFRKQIRIYMQAMILLRKYKEKLQRLRTPYMLKILVLMTTIISLENTVVIG